MKHRKACWFLAGPTACGKTAVGIELALRIGGEVLALDSMSLYRGMDVGTAKPTREEQERVPHHLLDLLDPHEEFTVADYLQQADSVCDEILSRGRIPLFVGGTGLYLRSLLRGVCEAPPADWEFRAQLAEAARGQPAHWLHAQLQQVDPASARRLHPHDTRRIIRALEVVQLTGHPPSELQVQGVLPPDERSPHVYWLSPPRQWLHERINRRVDQMLDQGLVDEVRSLLNRSPPLSRTACQALGYKELFDHLAGRMSLAETVERIKTATRQFAKRQHTWFRQLEECREIPISGEESPAEIVDRILSVARGDKE